MEAATRFPNKVFARIMRLLNGPNANPSMRSQCCPRGPACNVLQNKCTNGGEFLKFGCIRSAECTRYYSGVSTCINGCCCTVPNPRPQPPVAAYGFCYDGQRSNVRCSASDQCPTGQNCMNGLCCSRTNEEFRYACGGQLSLGACTTDGGCDTGFHCTASNYCCECPVGQNGGECRNGRACPPGFTCQANGYCCASCPDNRTPFGACRPGGVCGGNSECVAGNICC
uniref:CC domain-containing protein n=1 Tax=Steinernema glaseri TaxID=37863 RepID=A0A1I8AUB4_9BILA